MKKILPIIITAIIIGGLAFYGGMIYGQNNNTKNPMQNFQGMRRGTEAQQQNGGFVNGDIISKDNTGITVQIRNGGSKIILISNATQIMKATNGTLQDLSIGQQITATGNVNSDGSINAQSIQIRPNIANSTSTKPTN